MRFKEYANPILEDAEVHLLEGSVTSQLKMMVDRELAKPLTQNIAAVRKSVYDDFVPKLKTWAMQAYKIARMAGEDTTLLDKIMNNPDEVARQLMFHIEKPDSYGDYKKGGRKPFNTSPVLKKALRMFMDAEV